MSINDCGSRPSDFEVPGDGKVTAGPSTNPPIPTYCVACGGVIPPSGDDGIGTADVIKTEVEDGDFPNPQHSPVATQSEQEVTGGVAIRQSTEQKLFQQFCNLMGVKGKLPGAKGNKKEDGGNDTDSECPLFCQKCRGRLELLVDLQEKLKELERDFNKGLKEFKVMCQQSEDKFERGEACKRNKIYSKVRSQLCGRKPKCTEDCQESAALHRPTRKSSRNALLKLRTQVSPSPPPQIEEEDVSIKVEPVVPPTDSGDDEHAFDDVSFDLDFQEPLESPPEDHDEYEPPKKKKNVKTPKNEAPKPAKRLLSSPPKTKKKAKRTPPVKKSVKKCSLTPSSPSPKRKSLKSDSDYAPSDEDETSSPKKSRSTPSSSKPKIKSGKCHSDYAPSDDDDADSDDDLEASLKGKMNKDPDTGHVLFLHISFKPAEKGRYHCLTCNNGYGYHRASLKKHVITLHTDMFVCEECGQHCHSTKHLTSHIRRVHRGLDRTMKECPICAKPCSSVSGRMEKHMVTHMSTQEKEEATARGEKVPQWSKVRRHVCEICGMSYSMKSYLTQHKIREHPSGEYTQDEILAMREMCPDCGKMVHKHYLKKHQEYKHPKGVSTRVNCLHCEKTFCNAVEMRNHKHVIHDGFKPYQCPFCPSSFAVKNRLNFHIRNHTNVRPFKCPECPMAFSRKHHMERHVKTYHEPGANPKRKTFVRVPLDTVFSDKEVARGNAELRERVRQNNKKEGPAPPERPGFPVFQG